MASNANAVSDLERSEHADGTKKVSCYGTDGTNLYLLKVSSDGKLVVNVDPREIVGRWGSGAGEVDDIRIDASTNTMQTIGYSHHEIHSGSHYYIEGHATLADGGVLRVKLVTPDTAKWAHFQWSISSTGILETTLHEGASGGMGSGSAVTPLNNNRNSANTSGLTITSGVDAATTAGTLISNAKWGAAGFKSTIGGGAGRDDELMLKQDTTYLRTFTSSAGSNIVQFKAAWYEHEDKH